MPLLDEVGSYLVSQGHGSVSATTGWRIFKSTIPASTGRAIIVTEVGTPNTMGHQDASLDTKRFQVRVRGPKISTANAYSTAETKLAAIRTSLEAIGDETMGGRYYTHVVATMSPTPLGLDANDQPHLVLTFSALRSKTS